MIFGGRANKRIPLFFTVGWLFSELLVGIAMVFLIASPGATRPPAPTPRPTIPIPPTPTATPHPYLSTTVVTITITDPQINMQNLVTNDPTTVSDFESDLATQLKQVKFAGQPLAAQCAGLVIPYGGEPSFGGASITIGQAMVKIIKQQANANPQWAFFKLAVYHDPLLWVDGPPGYTTAKLEVYIFTGGTSCQPGSAS
jgi:hypothetical protein